MSNAGAAADNDEDYDMDTSTYTPPTLASPTTTAAAVPTTKTKEKRGWFHSLTRRKKSQSQSSLAAIASCSTAVADDDISDGAAGAMAQLQVGTRSSSNNNNNNNEPLQLLPPAAEADEDEATAATAAAGSSSRKHKEEKNVFQRFRKKLGLRFPSLRYRQSQHASADDASGTTDASAEFLTQSPVRGGAGGVSVGEPPLMFRFASRTTTTVSVLEEEAEIVAFTHDYKRFIAKKWLQPTAEEANATAAAAPAPAPNRVMYKACSEMLSQVWYWGEISRRDAQKQLTDKPTGSFLVRDSETSGCQFTLSFRILKATLHYRLEYRDNYWHFEELQYESIVEMIEDILYRCTNDNFVCFVKVPNEMQPPFPVILKYPLSRYLRMPHLQDLCRRVIQRHASAEEISKLPIPPPLLEYLGVQRELVFQS